MTERPFNLYLAKKGKPGHKHTEEHKQYMSSILKGRSFTEEHKQKLRDSWKRRKNEKRLGV